MIITSQIQLQREELLLDSSQLAKRARMGSLLHQGKNHPQGFDKLSGNENRYDNFLMSIRVMIG